MAVATSMRAIPMLVSLNRKPALPAAKTPHSLRTPTGGTPHPTGNLRWTVLALCISAPVLALNIKAIICTARWLMDLSLT